MKRYEDWPERLLAYVEARRAEAFAWGENDCALFVAGAVLAATGEDFGAPFRGRYKTALGAAKALRSNGAESLADYATLVLGAPITSTLARRGDVVLFEAIDGPALAVCLGAQAAAIAPAGVTLIPLVQWRQAWRVG